MRALYWLSLLTISLSLTATLAQTAPQATVFTCDNGTLLAGNATLYEYGLSDACQTALTHLKDGYTCIQKQVWSPKGPSTVNALWTESGKSVIQTFDSANACFESLATLGL